MTLFAYIIIILIHIWLTTKYTVNLQNPGTNSTKWCCCFLVTLEPNVLRTSVIGLFLSVLQNRIRVSYNNSVYRTVSFILGKLLFSSQQNLKTCIKMYCGDYVSIMICLPKSFKTFHCSQVVVTCVGTHFPLLVKISDLGLILGLLTEHLKGLKWKLKYKGLPVSVL